MLITDDDWAFNSRSNEIDHTRTTGLQCLGNYARLLPVSIERMMENALDWEHLPHVHASSFSDIKSIDHGHWGWRAKAMPTAGGSAGQMLELLVDHERRYWATSILTGTVAGIEVHTQATVRSDKEIEIDVRFFSAVSIPEEAVGFYLDVLQQQYALLYDEDLMLMSGRQMALDEGAMWRSRGANASPVLVGDIKQLRHAGRATVDMAKGRYCVRWLAGEWVVHNAVCPHLQGPLDGELSAQGRVTCPWHGFSFDVRTGENLDGRCRALGPAPHLREADGKLYLIAT